MSENILEVKNLKQYFPIFGGVLKKVIDRVKAVDSISFELKKGQTFGLVGESGCGKTTVGRCIVRAFKPTGGEIYFIDPKNKLKMDLSTLKGKKLKDLRSKIQFVFQDPASSINPRMLVKDLVAEPLKAYKVYKRERLKEKVTEILKRCGLGEDCLFRYPHEFSGGQRQRICIARALTLNPSLLILDEPTSAIDVSVQAQILNLLKKLQKDLGLSYLFISHNLGVIRYMADTIGVMYVGKLVEVADKRELFRKPLHPYTKALLSSIPLPEPEKKREVIYLPGEVPSSIHPPLGCRFHPRCVEALPECGWEGRNLHSSIIREFPLDKPKSPLFNLVKEVKLEDFKLKLTCKNKESRDKVQVLLKQFIEENALKGIPLFKAIEKIEPENEKKISIKLIEAREPELKEVVPGHFVACHKVS